MTTPTKLPDTMTARELVERYGKDLNGKCVAVRGCPNATVKIVPSSIARTAFVASLFGRLMVILNHEQVSLVEPEPAAPSTPCAEIERLRSQLAQAIRLLEVPGCVVAGCDGNGSYPVHGPYGEPVEEQCKWCHERKAVLSETIPATTSHWRSPNDFPSHCSTVLLRIRGHVPIYLGACAAKTWVVLGEPTTLDILGWMELADAERILSGL